jgi:hypothetical protein
VDPLLLVDQAESKGVLPKAMVKRVRSRMKYLEGAVARVEKASGVGYPPYYVEPILPVASTAAEYGQMGALFARVLVTAAAGPLTILVQFSAALVALGSKGTVEAVAAHEFTHYVDHVRRFSGGGVMSDERVGTLFESAYADTGRTVEPKLVFKDKALVSLIGRKFKEALEDRALTKAVEQRWVAKNLPMRMVPPEENVVRVGMQAVVSARFDPVLLDKLKLIQEKMKG